MDNIIRLYNFTGLIDHHVLENEFVGYRRINDKISYMIKKGDLVPIQKGKYISKTLNGGLRDRFSIANALYGPSYISGFTALSFHGLIPERVDTMECVTTNRSKNIDSVLGHFDYKKMPKDSFYLGIDYLSDSERSFLIANPTKAIIDALWWNTVTGIYGAKALLSLLTENWRIEEEDLATLDVEIIDQCITLGKRKKLIKYLFNLVNSL